MKGLLWRAKHIISRTKLIIKQRGIVKTCKFVYSRYFYFLKYGISLARVRTSEELKIDDKFAYNYEPVSHYSFNRMLRNIKWNWEESIFVDYGCGKGAAILLATRYNFKKYIGVELSSQLVEDCHRNIQKFIGGKQIDYYIYNCNATDYPIPDYVNVFYFFNPFGLPVLSSVMDNIELSLKESYRKIIILYFNALDLSIMLDRGYKIIYSEGIDPITGYKYGNYALVN